MSPSPGSGVGTEYMVYYNEWVQGGEVYTYGSSCLSDCSADSTCLGVQFYSTQAYQCYKITSEPAVAGAAVSSDEAHAMAGAWSVFMKNPMYVFPPSPPSPGVGISDSEYIVYYNVWRQGGTEYSSYGDCLPTCRTDSTCLGVQFYSTQAYQCYKITSVPSDLGAGMSMDDASSLTGTWSVFMKNPEYSFPPPAPPSEPAPSCDADRYTSCPAWASYGFCTHSYVSFMTANCKTSCCGVSSMLTTTKMMAPLPPAATKKGTATLAATAMRMPPPVRRRATLAELSAKISELSATNATTPTKRANRAHSRTPTEGAKRVDTAEVMKRFRAAVAAKQGLAKPSSKVNMKQHVATKEQGASDKKPNAQRALTAA